MALNVKTHTLVQIFHDENLTEEQQEKLIRENSQLETIIADIDRLREVANDIVKHFVNRGYLGKGMVISISKEVAVRMYDLVQESWRAYKQDLQKRRQGLPADSPLRLQIDSTLKYMTETEMAVVISYTTADEADLEQRGLNLRPHILKMEKVSKGYETIEDRFKKPNDPLRLVFVCAKWLTGFDAPTVSTLYLDKPMQNHTLMQTIARANRVAPPLNQLGYKAAEDDPHKVEKLGGMIIDYIDVFKSLEKALSVYAGTKPNGETLYPVERGIHLIAYLDTAIKQGIELLHKNGLDIQLILDRHEAFDKIDYFKIFVNALSATDELKKTFAVHQTAITSFYQACKPDINEEEALPSGDYIGKYKRIKDIFEYLSKIIIQQNTATISLADAQLKTERLIDESIIAKNYTISPTEEIDLSGIDIEKLQEKFERSPYQHLAISDFTAFLQDRIQKLLAHNITRLDLAERLKQIIDGYNQKGSDVANFFKALKEYALQLRAEEVRAAAEGLTEEELELFDLLFVEKLTKEEKQKVKDAARDLLEKLQTQEAKRKHLITDWHLHLTTQNDVELWIGDILEETLPFESYPKAVFNEKVNTVYTHIRRKAEQGNGYWA